MALSVAAMPAGAHAKGGISKRGKPGTRSIQKAKGEGSDALPSYFARDGETYWVFGIGPALYSDSFERTSQTSTSEGGPQDPVREEFGGSSFVMNGSFWMLRSLAKDIRFGGAVRWYGEYAGVEEGGDDTTTFGQLLDAALQGEFLINEVYQDLGVLFGLRAGGTVLFPAGAGLDDDPNIDGPKLGIFGEPLAGIRWPLYPKLALRAETAVKFGRIWLYDFNNEVQGISVSSGSQLDHFQIQWGLGLEFMP